MIVLKAEPWLAEVLNRSILVTGAPRSGTSLIGNLLHSCQGVEYLYEPQVVLPLLPLLGSLDESTWRCLFETTLVAEGMADRIAGRSINLNPHDEGFFLNAKPSSVERWRRSWSRAETTLECQRRTLVWKSPEAGIWAHDLKRLYPGMRVVAIWRSEEEVVRSISVKGWLAGSKEARWFHREEGVPFWWHRRLGIGITKPWVDLNEQEKAATLWASIWGGLGEGMYVVLYSELCGKPQEVFAALTAFLGLVPGPMTAGLLQTIRAASTGAMDATEFAEFAAEVKKYFGLSLSRTLKEDLNDK